MNFKKKLKVTFGMFNESSRSKQTIKEGDLRQKRFRGFNGHLITFFFRGRQVLCPDFFLYKFKLREYGNLEKPFSGNRQ